MTPDHAVSGMTEPSEASITGHGQHAAGRPPNNAATVRQPTRASPPPVRITPRDQRELTWRLNAAMRHGLMVTKDPQEHVAAGPLISAVEHLLSSYAGPPGERPRLAGTSHIDRLGGPGLRFEVALTADLVLPIEHVARPDIADIDQPADAAKLVGQAVDANWPSRGGLAAARTEMLRAAAALAVIASSRGIETGGIGVELAARSSWTAAKAECFAVSIEAVDDRLLPAPIVKDVADPSQLPREFAWELAKLRRRLRARDACALVGGVAWADELTLRAISELAVEGELPDPFAGPIVLAQPDLVLFWHQGVLRSLCGTAAGIGWCGTTMSIEGWSLPDTLMAAVRGRPVTELIGHPVLSERIAIAEIANMCAPMGPRLEMSLEIPLVAIDRTTRPVDHATWC